MPIELFYVLVANILSTQTWSSGLIVGLRPANERLRLQAMPSLIGWVQTYNQPWVIIVSADDLVPNGARPSAHHWLQCFVGFLPCSGLILGLRPANERRRYKVTLSLIGWAQT